jgi:hypothetical protein
MSDRDHRGRFLPGHAKIERYRDLWVVRKDSGTGISRTKAYVNAKAARFRKRHKERLRVYMREYMRKWRAIRRAEGAIGI